MNLATVNINPWEPFAGVREFQRQINRLLDGGPGFERSVRYPLVNVMSDANEVVDLEISLTKGQLTIRGTVKDSAPEGENIVCHRKERASGSFVRTFTLPYQVEEDRIAAKYDKGVLAITLPRAEQTKPKTIPVIAG
ncbi:MAG: Hsp20/alpha crystallin family protein [Verrucomicrobia bacterium]|nr:Hsp20/alpha crystallin family protein [Verrucomicrobiota bacterium]